MGLARAGIEPVAIVERDKWCCDTLTANRHNRRSPTYKWPEVSQADIRSIDFTQFKKIDVVSGGPPCQPFSIGGRHRAHEDHRDMWGEAVRVLRETKPKAFVFENVKGLKRQTFATYLDYILLQLQHPSIEMGPKETWEDHLRRLQKHHTGGGKVEYRVVCELKNTANYGVPQKRERVIFVGFRHNVKAGWSFPIETHSLDALLFDQFRTGEYWDRHKIGRKQRAVSERMAERGERILLPPDKKPWATVRDALHDLPDPERDFVPLDILNHRLQEGARAYPGHTGSYIDEPAKTLKAGVHGVPGGENMLRRADGGVRYFTVRESARLQTFHDKFEIHGSWSEAMRQLGNAVPVTMAEIVGKSVVQHLKATQGTV
jgi:DNA (cytosine-5)-methyltransferase 1